MTTINVEKLVQQPKQKLRNYLFDISNFESWWDNFNAQYDKQTQALIKTITYQGQTKEQWTIINTELVAVESKLKAVEAETSKSAKNTKAILDSWQALKSKTITLTENVNRIITTILYSF